MKNKTCTVCKKTRKISLFHKDKTRSDGFDYRCSICKNSYDKEWKKKNPHVVKKWIENNREKIRESARKFYKNHTESEKKRNALRYKMLMNTNPEKIRGYQRKFSLTPKGRMRAYKIGAKKRGLEFGIDLDYFTIYWQSPCYYCGDKIPTIGIDRIDSSKGYIIGNVRSCCGWCNSMKADYSEKEFIEKCKKIAMVKS